MNRRTFVTALASTASAGLAGCFDDTEATAAGTDEGHTELLETDVSDRGVEVHDVAVDEDDVVTVEHGYEKPNDAVANVAMAFVDRVAGGWNVDRLEGYLIGNGGIDYSWHAEAEWAQEYADGEIGPDEYGQRIRETFAVVVDGGQESV